MKLKVSNLLATFAAVFILGLSAQAQEELPIVENPDPSHREFNLNEDRILIYDRTNHISTVKDSVLMAPRTLPTQTNKSTRPDASKSKENEDDALSFNFLYYMLQKFKLSDLIDQ